MEGKVCIVTGASSGIGEATAVLLASRGASVTVCGRNEERCAAVQNKCVDVSGGHSDRFLSVLGDLNEQKVREDIVAKTVEKFGRLDVLVANAGVASVPNGISDTTEESYDIIFDTNVKSVFFMIQAAVSHLEKSKGNIVTVSSVISEMASSPAITYTMTKAAVDHMSRCLALDLAPRGIRVNTVNPSFVPTRLMRAQEASGILDKMEKTELKLQPLHDRLVTLEEVAESIAFLASSSASFVTGQNLKVDGARGLSGPCIYRD